jgi:predicted RNA-binding Zn-ribbon protein involved in translation (DUF1610 family)
MPPLISCEHERRHANDVNRVAFSTVCGFSETSSATAANESKPPVKFIWCELNAESGHHWRMSTDARLIVHFSCPQCATIYAASQEQRPGRHLGDFYCRNCGTPVHSWTGLYNFSDWMPVSTTPSKKRTRQRRCNDDPR